MPGWLRMLSVLGVEEIDLNKLERLDSEFLTIAKKNKPAYQEEQNRIKKETIEFVKEFDEEWKKETRLEYLKKKQEELLYKVNGLWKYYKDSKDRDIPYWLRSVLIETAGIDKLEQELKKISNQIYFLEYKGEINNRTISQEDIALAREVPFDRVIDVDKEYATCPFHNDKGRHLYVRNNYGYCFVCNWSGDVIQLVIDRDHLRFSEVVNKLLTLGY